MNLPIATSPSRNEAQPAVRGDAGLRLLDRWTQRIQGALDRLVTAELNPLNQTGAIANVNLIVAFLTGAVLLIWYSSSVHEAHASVEAMGESWLPSLVRSLHRYSSDACIFFVLLHALKLTFARRVTGARWVAWVTGFLLLALLWGTGWTGYWLVWDQRAQGVALGTAALADALPVFVEPLARSFLTDEGINSLLFFVVFFVHMLVPMGMGVALWLHISRVSRSKFLTGRPMTIWILVTLTVLSVVAPATSADPAHMAEIPQGFTMDWWYLFPLVLTDRLGGGALWGVLLLVGGVGLSAPWWLRRRVTEQAPGVRPAEEDPPKCNSCNQCFIDCPYDAISMVPRTDGRDLPTQVQVDPSKCVGCGICAGSCDSQGVGLLSWLPVRDERRRVEAWLAAHEGEEPPSLAFVCVESAGRDLAIDRETGACPQLPGHYALSVPCLGWVHTTIIDRALERGAASVLLAGCGPGACSFREGTRWTKERLAGLRKPASKAGEGDPRIRLLELYAGQERELVAAAAELRAGAVPEARGRSKAAAWVAGVLVAAVLAGLVWLGSDLSYAAPTTDQPHLVVSFKHMGKVSEVTRTLTEEELKSLPIHMRPQGATAVSERRRADVRLRVRVDGQTVIERSYPPQGLWGDKNAVALEVLDLDPGSHDIEVAVGESLDPAEWTYVARNTLTFERGRRRVVLFDRTAGFAWH